MSDGKKSSIAKTSSCHLLNVKQPDRTAQRIKLSFRRTKAFVNLLRVNRNVEASLGLIDISMSGAGVFTGEMLAKGSTVELCVTEPHILKVKGTVAWCVPIQARVAAGKFSFRAGLQFNFENEMQKSAVAEFMEKVNKGGAAAIAPSTPATGVVPESAAPSAEAAAPTAEAVPPAAAAPAIEAPLSEAPAPAAEAVSPAEAPAAEPPKEDDGSGSQAA